MAVTAAVKDELARLAVTKTCCRRAEACTLLRFASGLRIVGGRVVVQAELVQNRRVQIVHVNLILHRRGAELVR